MSNFDKYLDILNKDRRENTNPNTTKEKHSPLRSKQKRTPDRDSEKDFRKVEMPFNFYSLMQNREKQIAPMDTDSNKENRKGTLETDSNGRYSRLKRPTGEDMVINAL